MDVHDLIKAEDIEDAPEDPRMAFAEIVGRAQRRLADYTASTDGGDEASWNAINEARHSFMNVVVGLAKAYEIEPFASADVPRERDFGQHDYHDFKTDVDHYLTQILVDNTLRAKRNSVYILPEVKNRIRFYIHNLKEAIDEADISESKKASLREKLSDFEQELDKRRLSLLAATTLTLAILGLPGSIWASSEVVTKLTTNVLQAIAEAKTAEDEDRKLPPSDKTCGAAAAAQGTSALVEGRAGRGNSLLTLCACHQLRRAQGMRLMLALVSVPLTFLVGIEPSQARNDCDCPSIPAIGRGNTSCSASESGGRCTIDYNLFAEREVRAAEFIREKTGHAVMAVEPFQFNSRKAAVLAGGASLYQVLPV